MGKNMLGQSTVLPNSGRILKQYTISNWKEELRYLTDIQNNKSVFIEGVKIRKEDIV